MIVDSSPLRNKLYGKGTCVDNLGTVLFMLAFIITGQ